MTIKKVLYAIAGACLLASRVYAHHSFAEFDEKSTIVVKGVVTQWRLVNPHAFLFFDVSDASGKQVNWKVEFDGRTHIGRAGWTDTTFLPGEKVEITGNPAKSGSPYMFFISAIKGDGSKLIRPFKLSNDNAEAERQLRIKNRDKRRATPAP